MSENAGWLGVSPPLSVEPPKEVDKKLNEQLIQELKSQNNFESTEETAKREEVLKDLQNLLFKLVQRVGKQKGLSPEILKDAGGKVFTYGSYRLGVYGPGSDIDTLMVAPKHVSRDDFFEHMPELLKKSTAADDLTELTPVPGISVPIIKLEMKGVSVDLIFSNLHVSSVPRTLELTDNNLLRGLDETDLRCVNGTRVTDRILQLVPQTRVFRTALRAIKLWAQRRAIYGNVVGFPGGVAYAMLVARICQLYPQAAAPVIVQKFFFVMGRWQWPQAVVLQKREAAPLQLREWDPNTYKGDRFHLMPIITPAYPCMNSTHTIGASTKQVILTEFGRGDEIMSDIYAGRKSWKDLFARHTFFSESYKHYICIITAARTKEAQQAWSGLVQSKLRRLVQGIEASSADQEKKSVKLVQPFNKGFDRVHQCHGDSQVEDTLGGSLQYQVDKTQTTDQSADVKVQAAAQGDANVIGTQAENDAAENSKDGSTNIWTTTYYMGIGLEDGPTNLDISYPISDFKRICEEWENYDNNLHSIRIKHVRDYALPDDVFVDGETKPIKRTKKKTAAKQSANQNAADYKRSSLVAGLDEKQGSAKRGHFDSKTNGASVSNGKVG